MNAHLRPEFWSGKRVFISGHTGFKGSWLSIWLQSLGAIVKGYALQPSTTPCLFSKLQLDDLMESEIGDINDYPSLYASVAEFKPDIVFHLAAQPLVRQSYKDPLETFLTNIVGTAHLLQACASVGSARAVVNVTTDKCYQNNEWLWGYRETDSLGGYDPYSASKACSELVTASYRQSFLAKNAIFVATARAGNVIGGGDWSKDRLVPDILLSMSDEQPLVIRNPQATRPWQHVLEPLSGYMRLSQALFLEGEAYAQAWNFGPLDSDVQPVSDVVDRLIEISGTKLAWTADDGENPHEAGALKLDISKAVDQLGWRPRWRLQTALENVYAWHETDRQNGSIREVCLSQIEDYTNEIVSVRQT